jgi:hypothetical protein
MRRLFITLIVLAAPLKGCTGGDPTSDPTMDPLDATATFGAEVFATQLYAITTTPEP